MKKAILISVVLFLSFPLVGHANGIPEEIEGYAEEIGAEYGICPELLESIAYWESRFTADAVSKNGKYIGLMQVNPAIHKDRMEKLGVTDLKDPRGCMLVAADYLLELFEENEDVGTVLLKYSGTNKGRIGVYEETGDMTKYAEKILALSEVYERLHQK
jgi:soluble lytic murein transglycosylase-like protein